MKLLSYITSAIILIMIGNTLYTTLNWWGLGPYLWLLAAIAVVIMFNLTKPSENRYVDRTIKVCPAGHTYIANPEDSCFVCRAIKNFNAVDI